MSMRFITTWKFKTQEILSLTRRFSDLEGTALLFSGGQFDSAQSSFLCLFPDQKIHIKSSEKCWEELKKKIGPFDKNKLPIPYWVGYMSYEMGCFADTDKIIPHFPSLTPTCCFYAPSVVIHYSHQTHLATLYAKKEPYSLERIVNPTSTDTLTLGYTSDTLESYQERIAKAKKWILEGEIYQVNLSQEIHLLGKMNSFECFQKLTQINPAPFMAYLQCETFSLVSSSPERFLLKKGEKVETRPIKGTMARGKSVDEELQNKRQLFNSEKERAELLMITDLMRNDLAKICLSGTVNVKKLWECEAYTNVFHLLSILEGQIGGEKHPVEMIKECFPGGSITGCPKLRAMEAITELEKRARGVYTGSIGYFAENGDFDFNIAIRTLIVHSDYAQLHLGGGIVMDSDPVKEFAETLHKGESFFAALGLSNAIRRSSYS